jgi:hypothetical protein
LPSREDLPGIAALVSGGGRSLENLAASIERGDVPGRLAVVLSNSPKAFALERAKRLGIPAVVIDPERRLSPAEFSRDAFAAVESFGCAVTVLAGFLRLLVVPEATSTKRSPSGAGGNAQATMSEEDPNTIHAAPSTHAAVRISGGT